MLPSYPLSDVHGVTLRDKVRSCEIRKALNVEPLLQIERFQVHWFGTCVQKVPVKIGEARPTAVVPKLFSFKAHFRKKQKLFGALRKFDKKIYLNL